MRRAHIPVVIAVLFLFSTLSPALPQAGAAVHHIVAMVSAPAETAASVPVPDYDVHDPVTVPASDVAPAPETTATAPAHPPVPAAEASDSQPQTVAPTPATPEGPPVPVVHWRQKAPGYPLVSDDPAAQGRKVAMLTFDDGPGAGTAKILDVLAENHVKALFFITGYALKYPELVAREFKEGHTLGVHTMNHPNLTKLTPAQMRPEIEPLVSLIDKVTGRKPKYIRPPYGAFNKDVAAVADEYQLEIINWTNGSLDWDGLDARGWKDPQLVVDSVMKQLYKGSIILMHDTKKHTAEALPDLIKRVREAGYEFVVLQ
ncbi:MAG TPA: polysaccharide deacetylase family protein [Symbiobacteriaceae bacterium]|jgi:peptidoglycan/xylan/chitin deacetylase (PgdA/CDA1 family)